MKELKKLLNKSSTIIYNFLAKLATFIRDEKHALLIKAIIKLVMLILIFFLGGIIAEGLVQIGTYMIYKVGTSARDILSNIWTAVVNFTYFLFIVVSIYQLTEVVEKDNSFLTLYKNKKKDKKVKEKIFSTLDIIIKILKTIILIPLFIIVIALLFIFGLMIGYLNQGIYLISFFVADFALIVFFTTIILLIKEFLSPGDSKVKKYLYIIITSGLIVSISSITVLFETNNYKINQYLTSDFNTSKIKYEYKIDTTKEYIITNNKTDKNINLVIDDDLGSYIEVVITHTDTNEVNSYLKEEKDKVKIMYDEELDIELQDLEKILNLGLTCLKEKTIYNYTLLKYADIEVRVSSDYLEYIKFVDEKGKKYTPEKQ